MVKISDKKHITKTGQVKNNPNKVNLYLKLKRNTQKEADNFPMAFAFSQEQLEEGLKKLGVKKEDVIGIGMGGFIRKSDKEKYIAMRTRWDTKHSEGMKNKTYVYQAFRYELSNHEYVCTGDYGDTLRSLGLTYDKVKANPMWREQLEKARKDYLNSGVEC